MNTLTHGTVLPAQWELDVHPTRHGIRRGLEGGGTQGLVCSSPTGGSVSKMQW